MVLNSNGSYDVEVSIYEGWNIVAATLPEEGISEDSEIKLGDIKAAWLFTTKFGELSPSGEYVRAYPNPDLDRIHQNDDTEMIRNAMWIYSKNNGVLKYNTLENYKSLDDRLLYSGWNFAVIDPMVAKTLYEKNVGTCDIEKSYFYNAESQEWVRYSLSDLFNEIDGPEDEDFIGLGWVIKVSEDCNLGSSGNVDGPPGLPNGGGIDSSSVLIKSDIGDFTYSQTQFYEKSIEEVTYEEHISYYDLDNGNVQSDVTVRILKSSSDADILWQEILKSIVELDMNLENINGVSVYEGDDGVTVTSKLSTWRSGNYIVSVSEPKSNGEILNAYLNKYS